MSIFLASVVLLSSVSMAARHRDRFSTEVPGVTSTGTLDLSGELAGEGIVKGVYNDRNGRFVGTVRGSAPNLSGRNAVFRNDPALMSTLESRIASETGLTVDLARGVYRVNRRGRVSGSAVGRASVQPLPL
ncbi:MAG: hypothetical protein R3C59_02350 [Planctomycetaceae bacterium]